MKHVYRIPEGSGYVGVVDEENAGLHHLALDILRLQAGQTWSGATGEEEAALVTLSGKFAINIGGKHPVEWPSVGGRPNPFAGAPGAVCVPRSTDYRVAGVTDVEIAVWKARCNVDLEPALVRPEDLTSASVGGANWRRDVRLIFAPGTGKTARLIIGETINPPGNWSGFPPHKHDKLSAEEYPLEEIYLFKTQPADCFGVQLSYGGDGEPVANIVGNDDVAVFPTGYHPTVTSPGTQLYFNWVLAGGERVYKVSIDPRYRWLSAAEVILRESTKYYDVR